MVAFISAALLILPARQSQGVPIVVPVAAFLLELTGGAILVSDIVAGMTGVIAAVLWYECNKMQWGGQCENKPPSMPASPAGGPKMFVSLAPDSKRSNPDPNKFDDPKPGERDVKPKASQPVTPGTSPIDPADVGSGGGKYWQGGAAGSVTGGSAGGVALQGLIASYCVGGYATQCELRNCVSGSVNVGLPEPRATYQCEGYAKPGTMSCSPGPDGKCLVGYRNQYTSATQIAGTPSKVCGSGQYSQSGAACQGYAAGPSTCPPGYAINTAGSSCDLRNAAAVMKPSTTPCEVLWDATGKAFTTDAQNPNCSGIPSSGKFAVTAPDNSAVTITPNSDGGFAIEMSNGTGKSSTAHTGPYDPVSKGYGVTSTSSTIPSGQTPDGTGDGCGIAGKPACSVGLSIDEGTKEADGSARGQLTQANDGMKSMLTGLADDMFKFDFIPNIPTAACVNPTVANPVFGNMLSVDICQYFDRFALFIKAVLAVLCLYGCVRQIESAMKV